MSKLEDKLAASIKTSRDARPAAKPGSGKQPARPKAAGAKSVARKVAPDVKAETRATPAREVKAAAPEAGRPLHPRRVWPD